MYEKPFEAEEVQNYSQKCCVALVLDTSSSMAGPSIEQLNFGIQSFIKEIMADKPNLGQKLELGIITFDTTVTRVSEPKLAEFTNFKPLIVNGTTMMVDGVREGIKMVSQRKEWYKKTGQNYCVKIMGNIVTNNVTDSLKRDFRHYPVRCHRKKIPHGFRRCQQRWRSQICCRA